MASFGHVAVGLAAGRAAPHPARVAWMALFSTLSLLPDADVIAFKLGIPYAAPFGHRGATHSIAFAALCGGVAWLARRERWLPALTFLVVLSHPLLDMLTDGGLGCALFWPVTSERLFWPIRPIPVAPIGAGLLSPRGLVVVVTELVAFLPLVVFALWPRASRPSLPGAPRP
ncbi:MAG: metal-dependent hydrolase [Myxococcaceae bacterium]|nr:metal-dependent hydrolase [Myxococcaceae bacterium]MCA3016200.1 metal-dependent hydrolase [Myxococcaceae bacterium]